MSERRSRRRYSDEYKSEAVRLADDSGKTRGAVKAEQEEIVRLRRELARVT